MKEIFKYSIKFIIHTKIALDTLWSLKFFYSKIKNIIIKLTDYIYIQIV